MNYSKLYRGLYLSFLGIVASASLPCLVYGSQEQKESHVVNFHEDELSYTLPIQPEEISLAKKDFLPSECSISSFEDMPEEKAVTFLKYLGTFKDDIVRDRSPFTKEEQQIFNDVMNVEKRTKWWLGKGQAAILLSAVSPMIGFVALSNDISGQSAIVSISVATTFAGLINAGLAFYATGTLPDDASRKANDRQNKFVELKEVHTKLARVLVDLHFSDEILKQKTALAIAHNVHNSFDNLKIRVTEKVGYDHADTMLCPTKAAIHYVINKQKLKISPSMYDYIQGKETEFKTKNMIVQ
ncbi:MAG: hypothetical protein P4L31_03080 [Candidatus Babeliales bacterium]|nr:hypothetical protein [Candidatus Babeliales bacterium]